MNKLAIKTLKKPMFVWKVVKKSENKMYSVFFNFFYEPNKKYCVGKLVRDKNMNHHFNNGFHSYESEEVANYAKQFYETSGIPGSSNALSTIKNYTFEIVKCLVPAGSKVYVKPDVGDIVSDTLIFNPKY